eukprot:6775961-Prymnesium_polylepis.1
MVVGGRTVAYFRALCSKLKSHADGAQLGLLVPRESPQSQSPDQSQTWTLEATASFESESVASATLARKDWFGSFW